MADIYSEKAVADIISSFQGQHTNDPVSEKLTSVLTNQLRIFADRNERALPTPAAYDKMPDLLETMLRQAKKGIAENSDKAWWFGGHDGLLFSMVNKTIKEQLQLPSRFSLSL